jgi:hypothetical protein
LTNGTTINLAALPTRNLNVRANTPPATVGSVNFGLDGDPSVQVENTAPYALAGDMSGDYNPWTPGLGSHSLTATPYSSSGAGGTAGTSLSITFTVIDDPGASLIFRGFNPKMTSQLFYENVLATSRNFLWLPRQLVADGCQYYRCEHLNSDRCFQDESAW